MPSKAQLKLKQTLIWNCIAAYCGAAMQHEG